MRNQPIVWKQSKGTVSVKAPDAKEVFLAGSFNEWSSTSHPMERRPDGTWTTALDLAPGHYEYKFVIDGQWCCEPGCDRNYQGCPACVPNAFGTMNRVLDVAEHQGPRKPHSTAGPRCTDES